MSALLQKHYEEVLKVPSDINEHMPKLYEIAARCSHVTEFGVRWGGGSTLAFLAGLEMSNALELNTNPTLVSWDIEPNSIIQAGLQWLPKLKKTRFEFRCGDSRKILTEETDFLFIDTLHTYTQLKDELMQHLYCAKRFIGFHDTETYGLVGEDGKSPGLLGAIEELILGNVAKQWKMLHHSKANNGLIILERIS